ncbi:hypothetical protein ACIQAC_20495 [Streptomyces sp. NPDC088387]|uniref:hypothetical protein n=1 Tax=Streptomyces sp. NPDC088387 TaxID=3365859 RepID=UPI00381234DD
MTRRTRNLALATAALAAGLTTGGVALAADGDNPTRERISYIVEEGGTADNTGTGTAADEDCPWKNGGSGEPSADVPASSL